MKGFLNGVYSKLDSYVAENDQFEVSVRKSESERVRQNEEKLKREINTKFATQEYISLKIAFIQKIETRVINQVFVRADTQFTVMVTSPNDAMKLQLPRDKWDDFTSYLESQSLNRVITGANEEVYTYCRGAPAGAKLPF